jgi:hypothetical protein
MQLGLHLRADCGVEDKVPMVGDENTPINFPIKAFSLFEV